MKILPRLYPLFLGIVMFNFIRLTTDLAKNEAFWANSMRFHLQALAVTVFMCYVFDYESRYFLDKVKPRLNLSPATEYFLTFLKLFVMVNLLIFVGDHVGLLHLGNTWVDYVIADVIYIPLLFMYYILLRSGKMEKELQNRILQLEKIKVDQLEMELKFLRFQYHPHFLFNALNTVYFQIDETNEAPRRTIEMLSDLLRYQLYGGSQKVPVQKEIDYLRTYMNMQKLRMSERLRLDVSFSPSLCEQPVYPLLFLPLVENAFKYVGGDYRIDCRMTDEAGKILFEITNSLPPLPPSPSGKKGIGLENLKRRLELLYPEKHSLVVKKEPEQYSVKLMIEIDAL